MVITKDLQEQVERSSLREALELIAGFYPGQVCFSSSLGQEDQVITDAIFRHKKFSAISAQNFSGSSTLCL